MWWGIFVNIQLAQPTIRPSAAGHHWLLQWSKRECRHIHCRPPSANLTLKRTNKLLVGRTVVRNDGRKKGLQHVYIVYWATVQANTRPQSKPEVNCHLFVAQWNLLTMDTLGPAISGSFLLLYRGFPLSEVKCISMVPLGLQNLSLIGRFFCIVSLIRRVLKERFHCNYMYTADLDVYWSYEGICRQCHLGWCHLGMMSS